MRFGGDGEPLAVTGPTPVADPPSKASVALDDFSKTTKTPPEQESGVQTVDPPSAKEITDDEIKF